MSYPVGSTLTTKEATTAAAAAAAATTTTATTTTAVITTTTGMMAVFAVVKTGATAITCTAQALFLLYFTYFKLVNNVNCR